MPTFIEQLGQQAAQSAVPGAVGAIMGLALEGHNDRRQLRQQQKLQDLQMAGQRSMMDYSYEKQLQMWKDTSYPAQMEQMKKANLNPALMYGMNGGGGTTVGQAGASVTGGEAPKGGHEAIEAMGLSMQAAQLQLLQAQKANIEADTANKEAGTQEKQANTQVLTTSIEKLKAETTNTKAQTAYTEIQTHLAKIDEYIKNNTKDDIIDQIGWEAAKSLELLDQASRDTFIKKATQNAVIDETIARAAGAALNNILIRAQTENVNAQTQLTEEQKKKIVQEVVNLVEYNQRDWIKLNQSERQTAVQEKLAGVIEDNATLNALSGGLSNLISTMTRMGPIGGPTRNPIGFR